ncbi:MAG: hypothetical protein F4Z16_00495, partial [Rhodothermaceae bacterium]|nr:hypothetical protein [Rhodothermaceae bacterium]MYD68977.1 hypothetical protein [Rhodothermaceae bacterium]MYJ06345.1 hypothetical protein [Rhodothermaceae bacterium]
MILRIEGAGPSPVLRVDSLTVSSGATLTVGTAGNAVDLRVPLRKSGENDPRGILAVNGTIDGTGTVFIAHTSDVAGRGAPEDTSTDPVTPAESFFHMSSDYMPDSDNKANQEDCVWITGSGEIENEIRAVAAGNICVTLGNIGDITVAGSIVEPSGSSTETLDITTDVIFRNNVEVDGDVIQWNDARVVFEGTATVTGSVILEDGVLPIATFPAAFGTARLDDTSVITSVRRGVKLVAGVVEEGDDQTPFTCTYRSTMDEVFVTDTPVVSLSVVDNAAVDEPTDGTTNTATVRATLNKEHPDGTSITIPLAFSGTAAGPGTDTGDDYSVDAEEITISSGTTGTITITVTDDIDEEAAETIIVALGELPATVRSGATASVTVTVNASDSSGENVFVDDGTSDMRFFKSQNTATAGPGFYIPGVQFQGVAMIEKDLHVQSSVITNVDSAANRADTRCAPRVIFAAAPAGRASSAMMSHIQRDLVIEEQLTEGASETTYR